MIAYVVNVIQSIYLHISISKIFKLCIINILNELLNTNVNQFSFKKQHSTDMCIFACKTVTTYYNNFNGLVYSCFFDACKAFDKINHWTLYKKS